MNNAHVAGLNVTENQQDREDSVKESSRRKEQAREEDNSRALEPEPWNLKVSIVRMRTRLKERTSRLELDSSLVDRFEVWSLASS